MTKYIKSQRGYALLIVIMMMVVFAIIGTGMLSITTMSLENSVKEKATQSSYYLAENGVNLHMLEVEKAFITAREGLIESYEGKTPPADVEVELERAFEEQLALLNGKVYTFEEQNGEPTTATVSFEKVSADASGETRYKVVSEGKVGSEMNGRVVEGHFTLQTSPGTPVEVDMKGPFSSSHLYISESIDIGKTNSNTDIYIFGNDKGNISSDQQGSIGSGKVHVEHSRVNDVRAAAPGFTVVGIDAQPDVSLPVFPAFPTGLPKVSITSSVKLTGDADAGVIRMPSSGLTIEIVDDTTLVIDSITGNGELDVKAPAGKRLSLYVRGSLGDRVLNSSGNNDLAIYLQRDTLNNGKNPPFDKGKDVSVTGFADLFMEDGLVDVSGNNKFFGHILTYRSGSKAYNGTTGLASTGQVIWAPYLDLTVTGNSSIQGGIIAKSISFEGNASFSPGSAEVNDIPFIGGGTTTIMIPEGSIIPELVIEN